MASTNILQLMTLSSYSAYQANQIFAVGGGGGSGVSAPLIPQTPNYYDGPGGRIYRNTRVLEIGSSPSTINKSDLVNAPKQIKNQLGHLIDIGAIQVLDLSGGTPGSVMSGDQVRQL